MEAAVTITTTFEPKYGFLKTVMVNVIMEPRTQKTVQEVFDLLEA